MLKNYIAKAKAFCRKALLYIKDLAINGLKEIEIFHDKLNDIAGTNLRLGLYHFNQGNLYDAAMRFRMALFFKKNDAEAAFYLARTYNLQNKKPEKVRELLQKALILRPKFIEAEFLYNKLFAPHQIKSIPIEMVTAKYDQIGENLGNFSDYKNNAAEELFFNISEVLKKRIAESSADDEIKIPRMNLLDLGCASGILIKRFLDVQIIKKVVGVELSSKILKHSQFIREYGLTVISEFHNKRIEDYLSENHGLKFDLITSMYSFEYIDDLEKNLALIYPMLAENGLLAFSLTKSKSASKEFNLAEESFAYDPNFVNEIAIKLGFNKIITSQYDASYGVPAIIYIFSR